MSNFVQKNKNFIQINRSNVETKLKRELRLNCEECVCVYIKINQHYVQVVAEIEEVKGGAERVQCILQENVPMHVWPNLC